MHSLPCRDREMPVRPQYTFILHASPSARPMPGTVLGGELSCSLGARGPAKETPSHKRPSKELTATHWLDVCPEQRKEWVSKVLAPSRDLVQRLGYGVTRRKETIITLALTNNRTQPLWGTVEHHLVNHNTCTPCTSAVPLPGSGSQ